MSKRIEKLQSTIEKLTAQKSKQQLTVHEAMRLAYAKLQIENKTASKVYAQLFEYPSAEIKEIINDAVGKFKPVFKTWVQHLPEKKEYYSLWDGVLACTKLSKGAILAEKAAKQKAKILAKAEAEAKAAAQKEVDTKRKEAAKAAKAAAEAEQSSKAAAEQSSKQKYLAAKAAKAAAAKAAAEAAKAAAEAAKAAV